MDPAVLEQNAQLAAQALAIPPIHDPDQVGYFDINGNPHRNQPGNHPKPFEHISCHLYPGLSSLRNAVSFKDGNARNFLRPQGQLGFFTWFLNPESLAARRRIINAPPILVENGLEDLHAVFNQLLEDEESVGANFARANQETCDYYSSEFRQFERFCIVVKRQNDVTKQPFTINLILLFFTWKYLSPHDSNDHLLVQFIQKLRAAAGFDPNEIDLTEIPDRPVTWGKDWPLEFGVPRGNMYKNMNRTLWALKLIHLVCGHDGPYTERKVNGVIITSGNPFKSPLFKEKYRLLERHIEKYAQQSHSAPAIDVLRDLPKVHESQFSNDDNETRLLERINNVTLLKARIPKRLRRGETGGVRRDGIRFPTNRDNPNNLSLDEFGIPRLMTMTIMKQKGRRIGQAVELSDIPKPDPGFCPIRQTIYNVLMDRQILGKDPQFMFCQFDGNGHPIDAPFLNAKEEVDYESRRFKTLMIDSGLVIRIPANEATNTPERIHPLYTSHSPCHTFMRIASICRVPFSDAQQGGRWESKSSALAHPDIIHPIVLRYPWHNPNPRQIQVVQMNSAQLSSGQRRHQTTLRGMMPRAMNVADFDEGSILGRLPSMTLLQAVPLLQQMFPNPLDVFTKPGVMYRGKYYTAQEVAAYQASLHPEWPPFPHFQNGFMPQLFQPQTFPNSLNSINAAMQPYRTPLQPRQVQTSLPFQQLHPIQPLHAFEFPQQRAFGFPHPQTAQFPSPGFPPSQTVQFQPAVSFPQQEVREEPRNYHRAISPQSFDVNDFDNFDNFFTTPVPVEESVSENTTVNQQQEPHLFNSGAPSSSLSHGKITLSASVTLKNGCLMFGQGSSLAVNATAADNRLISVDQTATAAESNSVESLPEKADPQLSLKNGNIGNMYDQYYTGNAYTKSVRSWKELAGTLSVSQTKNHNNFYRLVNLFEHKFESSEKAWNRFFSSEFRSSDWLSVKSGSAAFQAGVCELRFTAAMECDSGTEYSPIAMSAILKSLGTCGNGFAPR